MYKILLLISFVVISVSASAQYANRQYARVTPVSLNLISSFTTETSTTRVPGERMRNVGTSLILGGVVLEVIGIATLSTVDGLELGVGSFSYQSSNPNDEDQLPTKAFVGLLGVVGGIGMMVPGIIFYSKGTKRYNYYKNHEKELAIHVQGAGLSLKYHF
jgi:hypothetical protein